ncbi:MAG: hypothetical protein F4Z58_09335 [Acidimicrobiaceae bacterium]|nr:hypothetical protein [Acidimicrobiaceae bacterium]MXW62961.1 hypothetical protein [Acidimicrobiaceae bacterium]MXW76225.1 hypothetical protein [Acidimicrobiaceae bacterium]MYC43426.1 hypothetical protein [Acidimicrobiaceae bacterium]MYD07114.1 hypothetical protein [Acidimicrobiaceae bacterium]
MALGGSKLGPLNSQGQKHKRTSRRFATRCLLLATLLVTASCASGDEGVTGPGSTTSTDSGEPAKPGTTAGEDPTTTGTPSDTEGGEDPTDLERDCSPQVSEDVRLSDSSPQLASIKISQATYDCAHEVGLAFATDAAAVSTLQSQGIAGPLLFVDRQFDVPLMDELGRLAPKKIVAVGIDDQQLNGELADYVLESVNVDQQARLAPQSPSYERVWLVDNYTEAVPLAVLGNQIGVRVITVVGDLRAASTEEREAIAAATEVELLSDFGDDVAGQLEVLRRGAELPGGGFVLFDPNQPRRMVAMYGHPQTSGLGVLGEQGLDRSVERLRSIAEGYDADGYTVLPTFEIIATVAAGSAGYDGNFSNETALDVIRPWIEVAAANDVYVVLDLQPGLSDYLSQAKIYEEFLRLPHVGLALDPEWRLKPGQRHLEQIGTVDAAEINQVVDWLAGIVREDSLPQKLLVLHQFRHSMITNRHLVKTPAELAVLIHMDGQGPLATKYSSWNALTRQPDADKFYWGWKNFYDEDSPTARPDQVLALTPTPLFVSFQ